jgi:hypothetical protein
MEWQSFAKTFVAKFEILKLAFRNFYLFSVLNFSGLIMSVTKMQIKLILTQDGFPDRSPDGSPDGSTDKYPDRSPDGPLDTYLIFVTCATCGACEKFVK